MFSFLKRKKPSPVESPEDKAEGIQPAPEQLAQAQEDLKQAEFERAEQERLAREQSARDEELREQAAREESAREEAAREASVRDDALQDVTASQETAEKGSWLSRLKKGLSRTGQSIGGLFVDVKVDEDLFEELETALIMADAGVEATQRLLTALRSRVRKERLTTAGEVKVALRDILAEHLAPLEKSFPLGKASPLVVMIAGVNGAGKTTSIGKLANAFQAQGSSVLLAAGDTFRAAAREQLVEWGARNNVSVISQDGGDPAAVAFDAVNAGRARQSNVVMIDTAGRLPTQLHLMEELKKIKRVIGKADANSPHEVLLVIDGNTGQNAIAQIRAFDAAINLTGLVVTKLDGTAKGGTLAAVAAGSQGVRPVPVYWIGVGEGLNDLQPFVAREFAAALLGD
jgi:fused signal recognition particle receptor